MADERKKDMVQIARKLAEGFQPLSDKDKMIRTERPIGKDPAPSGQPINIGTSPLKPSQPRSRKHEDGQASGQNDSGAKKPERS
jgi:hypothetical protein